MAMKSVRIREIIFLFLFVDKLWSNTYYITVVIHHLAPTRSINPSISFR